MSRWLIVEEVEIEVEAASAAEALARWTDEVRPEQFVKDYRVLERGVLDVDGYPVEVAA